MGQASQHQTLPARPSPILRHPRPHRSGSGQLGKLETVEEYTRDIEQRNITPYLPASHLIKK